MVSELKSVYKNYFDLLYTLMVLFIVSAVFTGCEKVLENSDNFTLKTEMGSYARGDSIRITIDNSSSGAIYYRRCGNNNFRFRLVKLTTNGETEIRPDVCTSFNQTILEIRDGQSAEIIIPLNFGVPDGTPVEGTYQIELTISDALNRQILPPGNKTNSFQVTG